jgi:peptidoglycan/LPS O-acetylase OafA/YrhL
MLKHPEIQNHRPPSEPLAIPRFFPTRECLDFCIGFPIEISISSGAFEESPIQDRDSLIRLRIPVVPTESEGFAGEGIRWVTSHTKCLSQERSATRTRHRAALPMNGLLDLSISGKRSDGIDCLRAGLALWVLFTHLFLWAEYLGQHVHVAGWPVKFFTTLFQGSGETHPAVIGFIVLSGYCIHRSGFRRHSGDVRSYAIRRFFRIWPVYFLATLVGIVCFGISMAYRGPQTVSITETAEISSYCIAIKLSGLSAIWPALYQCSFQGNSPLTTVMVEIWLYVLYAIIVYVILRRLPEKCFWIGLVTVWTAGLLYVSQRTSLISWWHNGSLLNFSVYWWLGAIFLSQPLEREVGRFSTFLLMIWLLLTVLLTTKLIHSFFLVEIRMLVFALLFGLLVTKLDRAQSRLISLGSVPGKAGYSIYAFHAPLLLVFLMMGMPWWIVSLAAIGMGLFMYKMFEEPFMNLGKRVGVKSYVTETCTVRKSDP